MAAIYDAIGRTYSSRRQPDPKIAAATELALGDSRSVLNVGAGTGSYEPRDRRVVAVEPSSTMIAQRSHDAAPVIQARAEQLPFVDDSFDSVLGVLTLHHWSDRPRGLAECRRVARGRIVLLTVDFEVCRRFWLTEYIPDLFVAERDIFPSVEEIGTGFRSVACSPVPVPADCRDGFLCAYWKRPEAYLDPLVRASISTFSKIEGFEPGITQLRRDIESGDWARRHADLLQINALDLGYGLVTAGK